MLEVTLEWEVAQYIEKYRGLLDEKGRRLVVRNGHHKPRELTTGIGKIPVKQPRVQDRRDGQRAGQIAQIGAAECQKTAARNVSVSHPIRDAAGPGPVQRLDLRGYAQAHPKSLTISPIITISRQEK